ncbi:hypothetical protein OC844_007496 [Tilletia horrida]|nr:hypothetical protein OC844_007496 [Tilletia horrida]
MGPLGSTLNLDINLDDFDKADARTDRMTGSSSIRLRRPPPQQQDQQEQEQEQEQQPQPQRIVAPTPLQRPLRLNTASSDDSSSDDDADADADAHQQQSRDQEQAQRNAVAAVDPRSTTPALPPPRPAQVSSALDHLEQRRRKAEDDAKMEHARRIIDREIHSSTPRIAGNSSSSSNRAASPRILHNPFSHHHPQHQHQHTHSHHHPLSILRPASAASKRSSSDSARPRIADLPDPAKSPMPVSLQHARAQGQHVPHPTSTRRRRRTQRPASVLSTDSTSRHGVPRRGVVATISARQRAAAEKKEAHRRQKRLKRFSELDPLAEAGALDEEAVRLKREREEESARALQRELALTLPGRTTGQDAAEGDHHNWEVVDTLDVVDPGVATVSALTNVANAIIFPYLPSLFNRMPVVDLPLEAPEPDARSSLSSDVARPLIPQQQHGSWAQRLRRNLSRREQQPSAETSKALEALEEGRAATAPGTPGSHLKAAPSAYSSRKAARKRQRAQRKAAQLREQQKLDPLDTHVETLLNNRKRAQLKRVLKGLWAFLKTPQGIIVGIYGFLVVFCGAALVIFLLGWIDHGNNKDFWVEVFSQAVNGLFTLTGVGLIPWRVRDTVRMAGICYYQHKIWRLRKRAHLPPLKDKNDLPDSQAPITDIEERKTRIVVDGKQYGEGDVPSEPSTPVNGAPGVPVRTGTPLHTIPESNSASGGLTLDAAVAASGSGTAERMPKTDPPHSNTESEAAHIAPPRTKTPQIDRVRSPPIARTSSPHGGRRRAPSPVPRAGTASPTLASARSQQHSHPHPPRAPSISWEPIDNPAPGGPTGHFIERPPSAVQVFQQQHPHLFRPGSAPPGLPAPPSTPGPKVSPLREVAGTGTGFERDSDGRGAGLLSAVPSHLSVNSFDHAHAVRLSFLRGNSAAGVGVGVGVGASASAGADVKDTSGYFHRSRTSIDSAPGGTPGRSSVQLSQYYSAEEQAALQDMAVLSAQEAHKLHVLQTQFAHGASWYRPHETPTHRAFPISTALWITILNDGNSLFQCMLCGVMWGYATHYKDRPAWTTGTLIPCSFLCGIGAAVLIAMGSKKTKKTDEVEERLRAAFAERERQYLARKKRLEEEGEEEGSDDEGDEKSDEDEEDEDETNPVSRLEAMARQTPVGGNGAAGNSGTAYHHISLDLNHPSPVRPVAQRGVTQPLDELDRKGDDSPSSSKDNDKLEADVVRAMPGLDPNGFPLIPMTPLGSHQDQPQHQEAAPTTSSTSTAAWPAQAASAYAPGPAVPHLAPVSFLDVGPSSAGAGAGALSSLQHFEHALEMEDEDGDEEDPSSSYQPLASGQAHAHAHGGPSQREVDAAAMLSPVSEEDAARLAEAGGEEEEEKQTEAGVATALFGLGGVQGVRGP